MWPGFSGGKNIYGSCRAHKMNRNPRALPSLAVQIKDICSVWLLLAPSFGAWLLHCHPAIPPAPGDAPRCHSHFQVLVPGDTARSQVPLSGSRSHSLVPFPGPRCHSQMPGTTLRSQVPLPGLSRSCCCPSR